jgi:hypothetical protein
VAEGREREVVEKCPLLQPLSHKWERGAKIPKRRTI